MLLVQRLQSVPVSIVVSLPNEYSQLAWQSLNELNFFGAVVFAFNLLVQIWLVISTVTFRQNID